MFTIAIGGAIGTGLFLGAGQTIAMTGPSILLTYIIIGSCYLCSCVDWEKLLFKIRISNLLLT